MECGCNRECIKSLNFSATTWTVLFISLSGLLILAPTILDTLLSNSPDIAEVNTPNVNEIINEEGELHTPYEDTGKRGDFQKTTMKNLKNKLMIQKYGRRNQNKNDDHDSNSNQISLPTNMSSNGYFIPDLVLMGPPKSGTSSFGINMNKYIDVEYFGKETRYWGYG